jgi:tripartite-type tricarboxylate transporter receptor subunit TctC
VTGRKRSPIAPDVSTATEQGFPDGEFDGLTGFFGPRGMPADRRDRVAADIQAVASDPSFVERLTTLGQTVRGSTPAEFTAAIAARTSLERATSPVCSSLSFRQGQATGKGRPYRDQSHAAGWQSPLSVC